MTYLDKWVDKYFTAALCLHCIKYGLNEQQIISNLTPPHLKNIQNAPWGIIRLLCNIKHLHYSYFKELQTFFLELEIYLMERYLLRISTILFCRRQIETRNITQVYWTWRPNYFAMWSVCTMLKGIKSICSSIWKKLFVLCSLWHQKWFCSSSS